jgi:hypothetical protein
MVDGADLLEDRHGGDGADNNIVVSIEKNRRGQGDSDPADFPVLFHILPERAPLVVILVRRRATDLGYLLARKAILLVGALVVDARHNVHGVSNPQQRGQTREDKGSVRAMRLAATTDNSAI